jgi:hypothetical protein
MIMFVVMLVAGGARVASFSKVEDCGVGVAGAHHANLLVGTIFRSEGVGLRAELAWTARSVLVELQNAAPQEIEF